MCGLCGICFFSFALDVVVLFFFFAHKEQTLVPKHFLPPAFLYILHDQAPLVPHVNTFTDTALNLCKIVCSSYTKHSSC